MDIFDIFAAASFEYAVYSNLAVTSLFMAVDEIVPVGNPEWEHIWERQNSFSPNQDQTVELLKHKFQEGI